MPAQMASGPFSSVSFTVIVSGSQLKPRHRIAGQAPGLFDYSVHNKYEIDGSMAYE